MRVPWRRKHPKTLQPSTLPSPPPRTAAGLQDCDAILTSFRPGSFFMALRSIHVMQSIVADMEAVCPRAIPAAHVTLLADRAAWYSTQIGKDADGRG